MADYSQIELRLLAHLSGDEQMCQAFREGADIHLKTSELIFGQEAHDPLRASELRRMAKTVNFGVVYGISAFRLADQLKISRTEAQRFIDGYFAQYPRVLEYFAQIERQASEVGYVETMFGRRRSFKGYRCCREGCWICEAFDPEFSFAGVGSRYHKISDDQGL